MSMKKFQGVVQFIHPGAEHKVGADADAGGWWQGGCRAQEFRAGVAARRAGEISD